MPRLSSISPVLMLLLLSLTVTLPQAAELPQPSISAAAGQPPLDLPRLQALYATQPGPYLWHDRSARPRQPLIDSLLQAVDLAVAQGLPASRYHDARLVTETDPAQRDLLLSDALLRLVRDLGRGRDEAQLKRLWYLPRPELDVIAQAQRALQDSNPRDLILELAPSNPRYKALVSLYQRYRLLAPEPLPPLPADLRIEPGDQHPAVALLRRHLVRLGDALPDPVAQSTAPDLYDQPLEAALRRFQTRHGLQSDGIVGPKTLAQLNRPLRERLAQLRANLERWRWLPRDLGRRYILVSTAGYFLDLVEDEQVVFHTRTITGGPDRPTPSFRSDLSALTVNPTWTVPRSIMYKDLLPKIRRDPDWLSSHRMQVGRYVAGSWQVLDPASIDWQQPGNIFLRQAPGGGNSLGRMKFGMANPFSIYLHDTPAQSLFNKPVRAFSSGCVRVQGIQSLVSRLLEEDEGMQRWYAAALAQGGTRVRRLPEPVPVYMLYLSAWVDDEGRAQFRPDIYGLDSSLLARLESEDRGQESQLAVY